MTLALPTPADVLADPGEMPDDAELTEIHVPADLLDALRDMRTAIDDLIAVGEQDAGRLHVIDPDIREGYVTLVPAADYVWRG